ncbi:MAG: PD-(D/E)XK nuclease family protein, partial [Acetobacteraceae bacterium]
AALAPALRMAAAQAGAPTASLDALLEAAEALAATDTEPGASRLWAAEEGAALAGFLATLRPAFAELPDQAPAIFPELLDAALVEAPALRTRRALRGRDGTEHPRVFIWGLLEARLQPADVMVLGGLAETVWPPAADPGPWLSRPMRRRIGLPAPEDAVGQAAHDFVSAACAAETVVLSCPRRREGAPAVPARWLARLEAYLAGRGTALPRHPAALWASALDQPAGPPRPAAPPTPRPPVALRPRRLSVTEIETWQRDPYAIYARHVLRLIPLEALDQETDRADFGTLVHAGLARFLADHGARWPVNAAERLRAALLAELAQAGLHPALANWWTPRLERIADFVATHEAKRRAEARLQAAWPEVGGRWELDRPGGRFTLVGRADRVERWDSGFALLDYKTGVMPSPGEVAAGLAPQLPLEAAMLEAGGFGAEHRGPVVAAEYWRLTGSADPGATRPITGDVLRQAVADAVSGLAGLIDAFDRPERAYLSQPHPGRAPRFTDYAQLARVAERAAAADRAGPATS